MKSCKKQMKRDIKKLKNKLKALKNKRLIENIIIGVFFMNALLFGILIIIE